MTRWGCSDEDKRQLGWLCATHGVPGSGRRRYGAAMYFHRRGLIGDDVLEAYRVAAAGDADPIAELSRRGLDFRPPLADDPDTTIAALIDALDSCLSRVAGPGIAETRAGIARWRDADIRISPAANVVVSQHLPAALRGLRDVDPALAIAITAAAPLLGWITYDAYDPAEIGPDFPAGHAFASLIGIEHNSNIIAEDFDFGLFLVAPNLLYRDHRHAAPELYLPLTGPHGWRFAPDAPITLKPALAPVWNEPQVAHMTKVGPVPFLAVYCWTCDADAPAVVVPASDWAELEHLRL